MGHGGGLRYTYMYKYTHEVFSLVDVTSLVDRPLTVTITMGVRGYVKHLCYYIIKVVEHKSFKH